VPFLSSRSNGAGGTAPGIEDPRAQLDMTDPADVSALSCASRTR
jgi:hypothetical protein